MPDRVEVRCYAGGRGDETRGGKSKQPGGCHQPGPACRRCEAGSLAARPTKGLDDTVCSVLGGRGVEYRILGSLEVLADGIAADLGPPKQRAVLAVLILHANEIVPTDRLVDLVWTGNPPRTAVHSIQIYISELRKAIEPLAGDAVIGTRPPGYMLEADPESIDAGRFAQLVADGLRRLGDSDPDGGVTVLRSALELWGGPPLSDFMYEEFAQEHIRRLSELRLTALEELASAELDLGSAVQALPLVETAIATDALRERSRELQMIALYRSGRHADALWTYQQYQRMLADELGLDPSPALRRLEERILLHDPALEPGPTPTAPGARNPYKGLRAFAEEDAADFFGREGLVGRCLACLPRRHAGQCAHPGTRRSPCRPPGGADPRPADAQAHPCQRAQRLSGSPRPTGAGADAGQGTPHRRPRRHRLAAVRQHRTGRSTLDHLDACRSRHDGGAGHDLATASPVPPPEGRLSTPRRWGCRAHPAAPPSQRGHLSRATITEGTRAASRPRCAAAIAASGPAACRVTIRTTTSRWPFWGWVSGPSGNR